MPLESYEQFQSEDIAEYTPKDMIRLARIINLQENIKTIMGEIHQLTLSLQDNISCRERDTRLIDINNLYQKIEDSNRQLSLLINDDREYEPIVHKAPRKSVLKPIAVFLRKHWIGVYWIVAAIPIVLIIGIALFRSSGFLR